MPPDTDGIIMTFMAPRRLGELGPCIPAAFSDATGLQLGEPSLGDVLMHRGLEGPDLLRLGRFDHERFFGPGDRVAQDRRPSRAINAQHAIAEERLAFADPGRVAVAPAGLAHGLILHESRAGMESPSVASGCPRGQARVRALCSKGPCPNGSFCQPSLRSG